MQTLAVWQHTHRAGGTSFLVEAFAHGLVQTYKPSLALLLSKASVLCATGKFIMVHHVGAS